MMSKKTRFNTVCAKNNLVTSSTGISSWTTCNMRGITFWMNFWKKIISNKNLYNEYGKIKFLLLPRRYHKKKKSDHNTCRFFNLIFWFLSSTFQALVKSSFKNKLFIDCDKCSTIISSHSQNPFKKNPLLSGHTCTVF